MVHHFRHKRSGGNRIHHTDAGVPKITTPSVSPPHYFEMTFTAEAGRPYRLWIRARAQDDFSNDLSGSNFQAA